MIAKNYDVIVIGGGVVGSCVSYYLTKENLSVGVIERRYIGAGTSGATIALVSAAIKKPLSYALFTARSRKLYMELEDELGIDFHYDRCGLIWLRRDEEQIKEAKKLIAEYRPAGFDVRLVDRKELEELEPELGPELTALGAMYAADDGHLDPFALMRGLHNKAKERGAEFYYYTEVTNIDVTGKIIKVNTTKGRLEGKILVIAAGAWSPLVTQMLGVGLPMRPVHGQVLVTQPVPKMIHHIISPGITQFWTGNILLGMTAEEIGYTYKNTLAGIQSIAWDDIRKVPALRDIPVIRIYSGLRPMPFDGKPLIDKLTGYDNVYVTATHSGFGVGPVIGSVMAKWISKGDPGEDLSAYSLRRGSLSKEPVPYREGEWVLGSPFIGR
jgi:sarcosine oxidase subunit beta